jgi:ribA/ribD-fused uncharacterized protein
MAFRACGTTDQERTVPAEPITSFHGPHEFLSNFSPSPIEVEGILYPTVEHAFQAAKTHDPAEKQAIANLPKPGQAKRAGKKVQLRPDWESVKVGIMFDLVLQKFEITPGLSEQLAATGDAELVEGNNWNDTFWGVCRGQGRNELGKILMRIRVAIQDEMTEEDLPSG